MRGARTFLSFAFVCGCANILGIDSDQKSAVESLCKCPAVESYYGDPSTCVSRVEAKLKVVTEPKRAEWLQNFDQHCAQHPCDDPLACLAFEPTCIDQDDPCGNPDGKACCSRKCQSDGKCSAP